MITDRGDAYFDAFDEGYRELLADEDAGVGAFYLLLDEDGSVLGRFNLTFGTTDTAVLGYRVAEHVCGRGVATANVEAVCRLAASRHGIRLVRAAAADSNAASRQVLVNAGFVLAGPAEPQELGGKTGDWYERQLTELRART